MMLGRRRTLHLFVLMLTTFTLAVSGACAPTAPQDKAEQRPTGQEVSEQAAASTRATDIEELVLYSASIEEAVPDAAEPKSEVPDAGTPVPSEPTVPATPDADAGPQNESETEAK
jgi:hypothetical protein